MFREYDIRGRAVDGELDTDAVYHIARGFAATLREAGGTEAVVGRDTRESSPRLRDAAVRGLTESGVSVIDIGVCTTPMSHWARYHFNVPGLCMITASHNPAEWNGMKLGLTREGTLLATEIAALYERVVREDYVMGTGSVREEEIRETYYEDVLSRVTVPKKMKLLINTGNGTVGPFATTLFKKAGYEIVEHNTTPDPSHPNYTPNPDGTAMMGDTGVQAVKHGCHVGVAFDGDGDRLGITDEKGNIIWPDRYLILLSRHILKKYPGAKIIFDVKVSEALPEDIAAHGGTPIMWTTGNSYIKAKRIEEGAPLAGEMSGHIFYADGYYGFDDAFYAALKLLEYLGEEDKPLSELVADTPYYVSTPTIQVPVDEKKRYEIVQKLTDQFIADGLRVVTLSGARVYNEDGWALVRASANTPTLVLRFESKTEEGLERLKSMMRARLSAFPEVSSNWDSTGH